MMDLLGSWSKLYQEITAAHFHQKLLVGVPEHPQLQINHNSLTCSIVAILKRPWCHIWAKHSMLDHVQHRQSTPNWSDSQEDTEDREKK